MKFTLAVCLCLAVFCSLFFLKLPVKAERIKKNILIINSYHKGYSWTDGENEGLREAFSNEDHVTLFVEYMDWKRYADQNNLNRLYDYYKSKYANEKIDIIITTDDAALSFALTHRKEIFSDAPVVFCGVVKESADKLVTGVSNVTGVYEATDPKGTIRAAQRIVPGMKDVYIIHDKMETGIAFGKLVHEACSSLDSNIIQHDLSEYSFDTICRIVSGLDTQRSIVILDAYNVDAAGRRLTMGDYTNLIEGSSAPVFTTAELLMGKGCIGGSLLSPKLHGSVAGGVVKRILNGENINLIPIIDEKSVYFSLDNNVLKRFAIPLDRLPPDSKIINKPFSFYEAYKSRIYLLLAVFTTLLVLIGYLVMNIKLRRKVEATLRENNEELTALYEEIAASDETLRRNFGELIEQQQQINKLAYYDAVTGLPNRVLFQDKVNDLIETSEEYHKRFVLFFIDLDNFKMVNDSFGHSMGDKLLLAVGKRLYEMEQDNCMAFRIGGDEFILMCQHTETRVQAEEVAQKILQLLSEPYDVENNLFHVSASIGIVFYTENGSNYDELLKNVDNAMYHSKETGKGTYTFYNMAMGDAVLEKIKLQNDMHNAIEHNEFILYYQPLLDVQSVGIKGVEALIRWKHPVKGFITPDQFIGIAEESGKMIKIGTWVMETACRFAKELYEQGCRDFHISVNVSAVQLLQKNFVALLSDILEKTDLPPNYLMIELTESILIESFDQVIQTLLQVRSRKIKIALDDFGCGYSSLTYLRQLPIDVLKIDKTFVADILNGDGKDCITGSIIMLAQQMGLHVIAEGVERNEQLEYLRHYKCDQFQGYLVSKPVPQEEIMKFFSRQS
ncbi:diguanylate cyclase (GGDEF)-like protein [Sporomusa sp. KB1]|jgi:diguanylate cyclase (GGDEF)-like protein|nr:diguanylate cyclase (GGDEF)-like protein [Sporomusa sp. KB1]